MSVLFYFKEFGCRGGRGDELEGAAFRGEGSHYFFCSSLKDYLNSDVRYYYTAAEFLDLSKFFKLELERSEKYEILFILVYLLLLF